jgi:plasmid stability protein
MAQLVVRNLDEQVKMRLRARAAAHGRSMEEEARVILAAAVAAVRPRVEDEAGLGTRIARRFAGRGLNGGIEELRGGLVRPAAFDEGS